MKRRSIGVAGAGLLGRLLAWHCARLGHEVTVFDPASGPEPRFDGLGAAGFTAAGMLSPLAEMDTATPAIALLGWRSIALWRGIVASLHGQPHFAERGSLLLAQRGDVAVAQRVLARIGQGAGRLDGFEALPETLDARRLAQLEPALHGPAHAWLLPGEAQIDAVAALQALHDEALGVQWRWQTSVVAAEAGALHTAQDIATGTDRKRTERFDLVFDVRGVGAKPQVPVRGVRGETVWLHAPNHGLTRPVRLLHPRHRVYLVPRPGDVVLIGATEVESEDRSPVSLRSAVELMAAAHSVMPALAEARILRLDRNLRPALPDNEPCTHAEPGLVRINGLFRHGWLLAPALVEDALARCGLQAASTGTSPTCIACVT